MRGITLTRICVVVFVICFCVIAIRPEAAVFGGVAEGGEEIRTARSLAFHGAFANPFVAGATGETAHVAPVYPLLLAGYIRVVGTGYLAQIGLESITVATAAATLALLPLVAESFGLGWGVGVIAAALGLVSIRDSLDGSWDQYFVGLLLLVGLILLSRGAVVWAGLVFGVLVLTNPVTLLLLLTWPFLLWKGFERKFLVVLAVAVVVITPWIVRDYARFHAFVFVRDNLGLELSLSNNDCAAPTYKANEVSGCFKAFGPDSNPAVARELASQGEYKFNRVRLHQALSWINSNRVRFLVLTISRAQEFWFPTLPGLERGFWVVTLLAFAGIAFAGALAPVLAVTWVLYPCIYYVVAASPRYGCPITWTLLLPAAITFMKCSRIRLRWPTVIGLERGVSALELLIVCAVVLVIAAIAIPTLLAAVDAVKGVAALLDQVVIH